MPRPRPPSTDACISIANRRRRSESAVRCVFRIEDHSPFLAELLHSAALMQLVQPLLGEAPVADSIQYID